MRLKITTNILLLQIDSEEKDIEKRPGGALGNPVRKGGYRLTLRARPRYNLDIPLLALLCLEILLVLRIKAVCYKYTETAAE